MERVGRRRGVRAREPGLAARGDARRACRRRWRASGWPGSSGAGRPPLGRRAAAARARRRARPAARPARARRADGEPRSRRGARRSSSASPPCASAAPTTVVLVEHDAALAWPLADLVLALGADGAPDRRRRARPRSSRDPGADGGGRDLAARTTGRAGADGDAADGAPARRRRARRWRSRGVAFGYEPRAARSCDVDLDVGGGRAGRAGRAERQRQVDARAAARRPAPTDDRGRSGSVAAIRAAAARPQISPGGPATSSRIRSGSSSRDTVADEVELGLAPDERRGVDD